MTTRKPTRPTPAPPARPAWVRPAVAVMRAGDAETGPTPLNQEGFFGTGS